MASQSSELGAPTETAMKEIKMRVEDALNATKAAAQEGIVVGGGVALLRAAKVLDKFTELTIRMFKPVSRSFDVRCRNRFGELRKTPVLKEPWLWEKSSHEGNQGF